MEKLLNAKQVAEALGLSPLTVYSWIHRGADMPPYIKIGRGRGPIRFKEKSLQAWIDARERDR